MEIVTEQDIGLRMKMKVLLLTGTLAETLVRETIQTAPKELSFKIKVLPLAVAAFLHPKYVVRQLKGKISSKDFDLILLPGMVSGDTSIITQSLKIPAYKGPRHIVDLPLIWDHIMKADTKLSSQKAADRLIVEERTQKAKEDLQKAEALSTRKRLPPQTLQIGYGKERVFCGPAFPMRIIAEITDIPLKTKETWIQTAQQFHRSGASIIDIGMIAEAPHPEIAYKAVKTIRKVVPIPISIDSTDPSEINAGVEAGASFVLSLNQKNMSQILPKLRTKATYTVIPLAHNSQTLPKNPTERTILLEKVLTQAQQLGFAQLVADPLIEPLIAPGAMSSLEAYSHFHENYPKIHTVMGIGNITELLDADSPGVNALLAALASELGVTFLLSTEVGAKTRGAIQELSQAAQMMYLAKKRQVHPKDLGIDLLMLKSKTFPEPPYQLDSSHQKLVQDITNEPIESKLDPKGYFIIHLDRVNTKIVAYFYPHIKTPNPKIILVGSTAEQLINAILNRDLISSLAHAAYLGQELTKAEIALVTSRPYIQETPLFSY